MSVATAPRMPSPPRRAWEENKGTIKDLYITKKNTLRDVMRMMEQRGFTASEQQYKIKFNEWGISKYKKAGARENTTGRADQSLVQVEAPTTTEIGAPGNPQLLPVVQMPPLDFSSSLGGGMAFDPNDYAVDNDFNISYYSAPFQPMNLGTPTSTKLRQPIHQAAQSGNLAMVKLLLERFPACAGLAGTDGGTALGLAAQAGHLEVVKLLLGYEGVDVDVRVVKTLRTPIHQAAQGGHIDVVRLLLSSGAAADPHDHNEVTPLWSAAQQGFHEIVQLLIDARAGTEATSTDGNRRPIHQAAQNGHLEAIKTLLAAGAAVEPSRDSYDDETPSPLWLAAQQGHCEIAKLLIRSGADVGFCIHPARRCPIHQAAQNGYVDMVALLIQHGADVDAREKDGWPPLMITAQNNFTKIIDLLLQNGASVNAEEKDGATALWVASQEGHPEVVKMLLERGAKSYPTRSAQRRPIHQAAQNGHLEVIKMLLEEDPKDVDAEEKEGITPLFLASQGDKPGHIDVARYLLEKGANVVI